MPIPASHLVAYVGGRVVRALYKKYRKRAIAAGVAYLSYQAYKNMPRSSGRMRGRDARRGESILYNRARPYEADGGSMSNNKRRRVRREPQSMNNPSVMTFASMTTGKHKSFRARSMSLLTKSVFPYIDRWNALTNAYDSSGYYPLTFTKVSVTDNSTWPVYTMELNSSFRSDAVGQVAPMLRLIRNDTTGNYEFVPQVHRDNEDTLDVRSFQNEYYTTNFNPVTVTPVNNNLHLDWTNIKMLITGPRKSATRVRVQLVRWTDDAATMPAYYQTGALTARHGYPVGEDLDRFNAHWQQYCASLIGNPLSTRTAKNQKPLWQVLKSRVFEFQPRDTSEDGPTGGVGDSKVFKWFNRVGHTYDFNRAQLANNPDPDEEAFPNEWGVIANSFDIIAKDQARLFLVVSAYTPTGADGTNLAADVGASFDLQIRRKWYYAS